MIEPLISDRDAILEQGESEQFKQIKVPAGTSVKYCGHVLLGMVNVELPDGTKGIMHPDCFPTLRN